MTAFGQITFVCVFQIPKHIKNEEETRTQEMGGEQFLCVYTLLMCLFRQKRQTKNQTKRQTNKRKLSDREQQSIAFTKMKKKIKRKNKRYICQQLAIE